MKSFVIISATFAAIFTAKKNPKLDKGGQPSLPPLCLSLSLSLLSAARPICLITNSPGGGDTRPALTLLMPTGASCH